MGRDWRILVEITSFQKKWKGGSVIANRVYKGDCGNFSAINCLKSTFRNLIFLLSVILSRAPPF